MARVDALAGRLADLKATTALGHQGQVREALTRSELTAALTAALVGRADTEAALRAAAHRQLQGPPTRRPAPPVRLRRLDRALARLGSFGQAALIARSGLWRGTGRTLFDLRHMAAYARRGAAPEIVPPAPFDQAWYIANGGSGGRAPIVHYLLAERRRRPQPAPAVR
ncbi:hypothetical protein [Phenylobacterium sp. J367]|uniref:hypothetical protein n=1 Tax=Phenylobacterium sp. J367 TaxID=2898435 RepID=UPI002151C837|nr:hypothetical protein [Phenylobacterium sp. J367]MCR5877540.1 hypothetical protein [Phenylobacterium sp. J367]